MDILLKSFINRLESLPDKPSVDALNKCVQETEGRLLPIDKYICFSDTGYKRNIVHVSGKCEITILCFKEGQATPIHDHGSSIGVTLIRKGIMTEELFDKQQGGIIMPSFTRGFRAGEMSYVNRTTIHRVSNDKDEGLVAINIYFPPLTLMNIYNTKNNKVEKWTADYSGDKSLQ